MKRLIMVAMPLIPGIVLCVGSCFNPIGELLLAGIGAVLVGGILSLVMAHITEGEDI